MHQIKHSSDIPLIVLDQEVLILLIARSQTENPIVLVKSPSGMYETCHGSHTYHMHPRLIQPLLPLVDLPPPEPTQDECVPFYARLPARVLSRAGYEGQFGFEGARMRLPTSQWARSQPAEKRSHHVKVRSEDPVAKGTSLLIRFNAFPPSLFLSERDEPHGTIPPLNW